jgi:hemoglobin-like flavoprotein
MGGMTTITEEQQQLVRTSFGKIEHLGHLVALSFYRRLFEMDPSLRGLFRGDIEQQSKKLMQALKMIAGGLERLPELLPMLESLGRRHVDYGVRDEHYDTVGEALLWSLAESLGPTFTRQTHLAWANAYHLLATTMKQAAAGVKPMTSALL